MCILSNERSIFTMNGSEIPRQELAERIRPSLRQNSITALIGRGQCCKTTLARQIGTHQPTEYFELDSPSNLERLARPNPTFATGVGEMA